MTSPSHEQSVSSAVARPLASVIEDVAVLILCVAVVAGPLALGGTLSWACFGLEMAMGSAALLWALSRPRSALSLLIPLAIAALVLAQIVPLPDWLLTAIAPVSAGAWKVAHQGMPDAWGRISVTPAASAAAARRLLLGASTIIVVAEVSCDPRRRRWLYTALATSCVLIVAVAFVFPVDPEHRLVYGTIRLNGRIDSYRTSERPVWQTSGVGYTDVVIVGNQRYQADGPIQGDGFGPYIYSNHFANALCLVVPAVCALWLVYARRHVPRWFSLVGVAVVFAAAACLTGPIAGNRAGTASLLFGGAMFLSLIVATNWARLIWGGFATTGLAALLIFVAVFQGPFSGLATFLPDDLQPFVTAAFKDARTLAARIGGRMFLASPVLGTGFGSYGDLFPRFSHQGAVMYFAHNDHAQLIAEGGLVALTVAMWVVAVLRKRLLRFCRERQPLSRAVDAAAWAGLAAGAAHAAFDWNVHAPANACMMCILVGLALSSVVPREQSRFPWASKGRWFVKAAFVATIVGTLVLLGRDAWQEGVLGRLRHAITSARLTTSSAPSEAFKGVVAELRNAIAEAERAERYASGDWQLPILTGQANLHLANLASPALPIAAACGSAAEQWFRKAALASPVARGIPEPERSSAKHASQSP